MSEIQIVLTTDNSILAFIARLLGAEWTHALFRFPCDSDPDYPSTHHYRIIEASMRHGVVEREWNPDEYVRYRVYNLKGAEPRHHECILKLARKRIGQRYGFENLPLVIPRFVRRLLLRFLLFEGQYSAMAMYDKTYDICTSLVDECCLLCWDDLVPGIDTPWVLPDDIASSPLLELAPPDGAVEWPRDTKNTRRGYCKTPNSRGLTRLFGGSI